MLGSLLGNYRISERLGEGSMGVIYIGRHELLGRRVAVKVLQPELSSDAGMLRRFFNEALAATAIRHPGIVQVFDFGATPDGRAYFVMELLEGETLTARLQRRRQTHAECCRIGRQVASVLQAAHAAGITHRDLKPDNLFFIRDPEVVGGERVKVLDFGIAKLISEARASGVRTRTGLLLGTPSYMAPEQCRSASEAEARSDIYSLGCILFEMVCGRPPFIDPGLSEIISAHLHQAPPAPQALAPDLPSQLSMLITQMLAKRVEARPQTMAAVSQRLDNLLTALGDPPEHDEPATLTAAPLRIGPDPPWVSGTLTEIMLEPPEMSTVLRRPRDPLLEAPPSIAPTLPPSPPAPGPPVTWRPPAPAPARRRPRIRQAPRAPRRRSRSWRALADPAGRIRGRQRLLARGGIIIASAATVIAIGFAATGDRATAPSLSYQAPAHAGSALEATAAHAVDGGAPVDRAPADGAPADGAPADGAPADASAVAEDAHAPTASDLVAECRGYQVDHQWAALERCAASLAPLEAAPAAEFAARAAAERQTAPHIAACQEAIRNQKLLEAKAALDQVWPESLDYPALQREYAAAERQAITTLAAQLGRVAGPDCAPYRRLLDQSRSVAPPRVAAEAARRIPCPPVKCDADALAAEGQDQYAAGRLAMSLALFEQAYRCKPATQFSEKALVLTCNLHNLPRAKFHWRQLPPYVRMRALNICVRNGITAAMLNAP